MGSVVVPAMIIVLLALIIVFVINATHINITDGDRLMFGAIGISGFMIAILTTEETDGDTGFLLG